MSHSTERQSARKRLGQLLPVVALGRANAAAGAVEQTEQRIRREAAKGDVLPYHLPLLHMVAKIDEHLVGGFQANQASTRVLDVEHDVDDDYGEDCEAEDVEPAPALATRHPKTGQQGTDETQAEQKCIDDPRRVNLQRHCAGGRDVDHVV
jgi:hypothetical protein